MLTGFCAFACIVLCVFTGLAFYSALKDATNDRLGLWIFAGILYLAAVAVGFVAVKVNKSEPVPACRCTAKPDCTCAAGGRLCDNPTCSCPKW